MSVGSPTISPDFRQEKPSVRCEGPCVTYPNTIHLELILNKDRDAIHAINWSVFPKTAEADFLERLRDHVDPVLVRVAVTENDIVGHIMFLPVSLAEFSELKLMGLAPMAVVPAHQRSGIGSALVQAGLDACRRLGAKAVVVLGHPEYYPRFGFVPASNFGIDSEYEVPDEVFMIQELMPHCLNDKFGTVKYHEAFSEL